MKVIPENYSNFADKQKLSNSEELLLDLLKNDPELDETMAILKVNPVPGIRTDILLLDKKLGAFFIQTRTAKMQNFREVINSNVNFIIPTHNKLIVDRITSHKQLCMKLNNGELGSKVPLGLILFFEDINRYEAEKAIGKSAFIINNCLFYDDLSNNSDNFKDIIHKSLFHCSINWQGFSDSELNAFHYALVPEYRIPKFEIKPNTKYNDWELSLDKKIVMKDTSGFETAVSALALTNQQIEIVNSLKPGHELILSCAGSGKSVLLASRAFKTAKAYPQEKILLTCYNRALQDYLNFCIDTGGMGSRNLICKTFHSLCRYLLVSNGINIPYSEDDKIFEQQCVLLNESIDKGLIKEKFYAIFIDEIQDFKKLWFDICLKLIKNKNDYILNIVGDHSQQIYSNSFNEILKSGPKLTKNKTLLEKNYRSTAQINNFINKFAERAKLISKRFDLPEEYLDDYFLKGTSSEKYGISPIVIEVSSLKEETEAVVDTVKKIYNRYKISYSDIAVLFPFWRSETTRCFPLYYFGRAFEENSIPFCSFENRGIDSTKYINRSGVVLSTIFQAKGIDFKAVILCGLRPLWPTNIYNNLSKSDKDRISRNINLIYTGITRAEELLYVILTDEINNSVYSNLLYQAGS